MSPDSGLRALARAVDAKDPDTAQHSARVARLACRLARAAGWTEVNAQRLRSAAYVHDVGKLGVSTATLRAARRLTSDERRRVELHPEVGATMLGNDGPQWDLEQIEWVKHHHERPDGNGYPDGQTRSEITEGAALLALADSFDVMISARPYKEPKPIDQAIHEVAYLCGVQFMHFAVTALESVDFTR